jgi:hypothetical protein
MTTKERGMWLLQIEGELLARESDLGNIRMYVIGETMKMRWNIFKIG